MSFGAPEVELVAALVILGLGLWVGRRFRTERAQDGHFVHVVLPSKAGGNMYTLRDLRLLYMIAFFGLFYMLVDNRSLAAAPLIAALPLVFGTRFLNRHGCASRAVLRPSRNAFVAWLPLVYLGLPVGIASYPILPWAREVALVGAGLAAAGATALGTARPRTRWLAGLALAIATALAMVAPWRFVPAPALNERLMKFLREADPDDWRFWVGASIAAEHLRAEQVDLPDLARLRPHVVADLESDYLPFEALRRANDLGVVAGSEIEALVATSPLAEEWQSRLKSGWWHHGDEILLVARSQEIPDLVLNERLLSKMANQLKLGEVYQPYTSILQAGALLEALGDPVRSDRLDQTARERLAALRVNEEFLESGDGRPFALERAYEEEESIAAVRLMAIYGIPAGLDIERLAAALRRKVARKETSSDGPPASPRSLATAIMLRTLERARLIDTDPDPSLYEIVLGLRLPLAAWIHAFLIFWLVARAPDLPMPAKPAKPESKLPRLKYWQVE